MTRYRMLLLIGGLLVASSCFATQWFVTVTEFEFQPPALTIQLGDTVTWTNVLGIHNVAEVCGTPLFSNFVQEAPWSYTFVFSAANGAVGGAVYPYVCEVHPDVMWGKITVNRPPQRWNVNVTNFAFTPQNLSVVQGDTVVWTNNTTGSHNVREMSAVPFFNSGAAIPGPWTYTFIANIPPATYNYQCSLHGGPPFNMVGTLTVTEGAAPLGAPAELVTTSTSGSDVNLFWDSVSGATCYLVYKSTTPDPSPFTTLIGATSDTFYTHLFGAFFSAKSFYQVTAINN